MPTVSFVDINAALMLLSTGLIAEIDCSVLALRNSNCAGPHNNGN